MRQRRERSELQGGGSVAVSVYASLLAAMAVDEAAATLLAKVSDLRDDVLSHLAAPHLSGDHRRGYRRPQVDEEARRPKGPADAPQLHAAHEQQARDARLLVRDVELDEAEDDDGEADHVEEGDVVDDRGPEVGGDVGEARKLRYSHAGTAHYGLQGGGEEEVVISPGGWVR